MRHNNSAVMAVSQEPNPTSFQKTMAMNDWYLGADDWDYPLGGIQMLGKSDEERSTRRRRGAAKRLPRHAVRDAGPARRRLLALRRGPPAPGEPGHARRGRRDPPAIDEQNNVEGVKRLRHKLDGMLGKLGMQQHHLLDHSLYLHKSMPIGATAHQAGTVRFGDRPGERARPNCRAHDVDNLYVVDTSFFPSIGAVNPSLTTMANALRVGDHLLERLR